MFKGSVQGCELLRRVAFLCSNSFECIAFVEDGVLHHSLSIAQCWCRVSW